MKLNKIIFNIFITILIISVLLGIFPSSVFAVSQSTKSSSKIKSSDEAAWKEIKSQVDSLQKKHPNWNFKVFYTDLDWNDVIKNEGKEHGDNAKNLVYYTANYSYKWLCSDCYDITKSYRNGKWMCASKDAIKYMMDPRNSINENDIFQFMLLSYDEEISESNYKKSVKLILKDSFLDVDNLLDKYADTIVQECKNQNVNPSYIAVKIIQEQGKDGGATYEMYDDKTGKNYYNIFNINATLTSTISNALSYSKNKNLTTVESCLIDGIDFIKNGYINQGQDTLYFEKFDVVGTNSSSLYSHQYAQDVMYAQNQGKQLRIALEKINAKDNTYTFVIPLYKNMPSSISARPTILANMSNDNSSDNSSTSNNNDNTSTNNSNTSNTSSNNSNASNTSTNNSSNISTKYKLGDPNGDNEINSGDLLMIRKYLLKKQSFNKEQEKSMDINKDGEINSGDLLLVRKHLLGKYKIIW